MENQKEYDEEFLVNVREITIEEAFEVHGRVLEFDELAVLDEFIERYTGKTHVIIGAYLEDKLIGYIIGYDKHQDKERFYIWMAGVDNNYRRRGALRQMMNYVEEWAKEKGFSKLAIKTRNNRREMLSFLCKNNFNFTSVETREDVRENRIELERDIL